MVNGEVTGCGVETDDSRLAHLLVVIGNFCTFSSGNREFRNEHARPILGGVEMRASHESNCSHFSSDNIEWDPRRANEIAIEMEIRHVLMESGLLLRSGFLYQHAVFIQTYFIALKK